MRDSAESPPLSVAQAREADRGRKTLIPFHGHPFLAYLFSELAEAGVERVCVVVGPGRDDPVRRAAEALDPGRVALEFAVQERPRGTAHALAAARDFVLRESGVEPAPVAARGAVGRAREDPGFLVVNADNIYPASSIRAVGERSGHALAGFRPDGLLTGTITRERLASFALLTADPDGCLDTMVEKPDDRERAGLGSEALVSMTLWRFEPEIFEACDRISRSSRGEYELPDAALWLVRERARCVEVVPVNAPVMDLTYRRDIPLVERLLAGREPSP